MPIKARKNGMYHFAAPYITSFKNGTNDNSDFLDMLILNGASKSYPEAPNYYLKISKSWVLENLD